jgi:hypothetical protein|tara:strand:- start:373 stop:1251 length:879 start_codon:yes stop_codon:yes gene_type:complete
MRSHHLRAAGGGGGVLEDLRTELQKVGDAIKGGRSNYNHTHHYSSIPHYNISYDGDNTYISDGGGDMYDSGNRTYVIHENWGTSWTTQSGTIYESEPNPYTQTTVGSALGNYSNISEFKVVAGGYGTISNPTGNSNHDTAGTLIMATTAGNYNSSNNMKIGFGHAGNLGADGSGTTTTRQLYNNQTVNGFTVHAWDISTYNASDPVVCNIYIFLGHPNWGTSFGSFSTYRNSQTDSNTRGVWSEGTQNNILAITALIAADYSNSQYSNRHSDSMLTPIIDDIIADIKAEFGY